jgi:hypothetical protein
VYSPADRLQTFSDQEVRHVRGDLAVTVDRWVTDIITLFLSQVELFPVYIGSLGDIADKKRLMQLCAVLLDES